MSGLTAPVAETIRMVSSQGDKGRPPSLTEERVNLEDEPACGQTPCTEVICTDRKAVGREPGSRKSCTERPTEGGMELTMVLKAIGGVNNEQGQGGTWSEGSQAERYRYSKNVTPPGNTVFYHV